ERLLSNKRVRPYSAGVNFVGDEVTKFHHVDVAYHHFLIELIAGASVEQPRLTAVFYPGEALPLSGIVQILTNLFFFDPIEHGSRNFESECLRSDAQVCFQNLSHIHTSG